MPRPAARSASPPHASRPAPPLPALVTVAVLAALAALAPALGAGFVHDDARQILANPLLRDLERLPDLWRGGVWAGAGSGSSWYRPLMMTSFAVDRALFGFSAPAMHAVSLLGFAAVVAVGMVLVRDAEAAHDGDGAPRIAFACGLLFAVHPLCVEPAVWISARCELLAALGGLAALVLHGRALGAPTRGGATRLRLGAAACLTLGLLGKESAAGFLPALAALEWVRRASFAPRALAVRWAPLAAGCALYAVLRAAALGSLSGGLGGALDPAALLAGVGQGALRIVWPFGLSLAPPPPAGAHAPAGAALAAGLALGGAAALRRRSTALVPLALAAAQLAIAALAALRVGELADRYLLPVVFAALWLGARSLRYANLPARLRPAAPAALGALALVLGASAFAHARTFHDDARLWSEAWRRNPHSLRAALNLAALHLGAGETAKAEMWLERAARIDPEDRQVLLNRAVAAGQRGRPDEARALLETLLAREPRDGPVRVALGHLALGRGAFAQAEAHYRVALEAFAGSAEAWAGLAVALQRQGRGDEARDAVGRALALDPQVENAEQLRALLEAPVSD